MMGKNAVYLAKSYSGSELTQGREASLGLEKKHSYQRKPEK
jgi:hypothetical protein